MSDNQNKIGTFIITNSLGIGQITEITQMGDRGDFFKVLFENTKAINFLSVDSSAKYRFLSSQKDLKQAIKIHNTKSKRLDFDTNQDRINYFKKALKSNDISKVAKSLSELNSEKEVHTSLKTLLQTTIDSFVDEIKFVLGTTDEAAYGLLGISKSK